MSIDGVVEQKQLNNAKEMLENVVKTAKKCSQFSMCKIDFLSAGVCKSAQKYKYNAYYPQGRMELVSSLYDELIPVTLKVIEVVESCNLCNVCRKQCYFSMELDPLHVMKGLKEYIQNYKESGRPIFQPDTCDEILNEIRQVVGDEWGTNDPGILVTYSKVRSPLIPRQMPKYVVLPKSTEEVAEIVKIGNKYQLSVMPRGNGTSFYGALSDGIVLDLVRLDSIEIDKDSWSADIGAGVTAFELQNEAFKNNFRANTAEPAACVCANVVSTNLHSLYSASYGAGADNYIDATVVDKKGNIHHLNNFNSPNYYSFDKKYDFIKNESLICTRIKMKLFPILDKEEAVVIPFDKLSDALDFTKTISQRRLGLAIGLIGNEYLSNFFSPTSQNASEVKSVLENKLGIKYLLIVVCDQQSVGLIKDMTDVVMDNEVIDLLQSNITSLSENEGLEILSEAPGDKLLYKDLFSKKMLPMLRLSMTASKESIPELASEDMKKHYEKIYSDPRVTDLKWITTFRISSARIGRGHMFIPKIVWIPLEESVIKEINLRLKEVGDKHGVQNDFGYLVPFDWGKRAVMEFDYYYDHTNQTEIENAKKVIEESNIILKEIQEKYKNITLGGEISQQGLTRPESYLYR